MGEAPDLAASQIGAIWRDLAQSGAIYGDLHA